MKITLNQDPSFPETEVVINCPQADEDILRLVAMLRIYQRKPCGSRHFYYRSLLLHHRLFPKNTIAAVHRLSQRSGNANRFQTSPQSLN